MVWDRETEARGASPGPWLMKTQEIRVLGVDPSLSRCGVALLRVRFGKRIEAELRSKCVIESSSEELMQNRLWRVQSELRAFTMAVPDFCGVEDFARNSRFRREEMGMATAAVLIGIERASRQMSAALPAVSMVSPREAKRTVCPEWHGWNKACWTAAGCTGKFKMSMPDKVSVMRGLHKRFGIKTDDDAIADACCVALHVACRALRVNSESIGN